MKKAFQKINSDAFSLGTICFGVKGFQPMQKLKKNRFFMLIRLYLVCLSSTHLGCSPPQNLLGCSLLWGAIPVPMPFCVRPSNDILQFHCPQPTQLIFLRNDACTAFVLILSSCLAKLFKIPSDSMIYWWTKGYLTLFSSFPRYFCEQKT